MAALVQVGDLTDYINTFMNIKLEIPNMTEEEAVDKFIRGLRDKTTRAYVRQYDPTTLKLAIHTAMSYDTAHAEDIVQPPRVTASFNGQYDPMELDAIDGGRRRGGYNSGGHRAGSRGSAGPAADLVCYFCGKKGHIQRVCRARNAAIKRLVDEPQAKQRRNYALDNKQGFH
ncbi:hypothetical protein [Parasitella parasitica]|uniref:CCHC-type domain-containing protein n=1 Tax=Parasitella parasitica TaxID=35722 RepID=A0A0B7NPT9_9FUNG|nr:hypothetical protein [Parasitella parasitica]